MVHGRMAAEAVLCTNDGASTHARIHARMQLAESVADGTAWHPPCACAWHRREIPAATLTCMPMLQHKCRWAGPAECTLWPAQASGVVAFKFLVLSLSLRCGAASTTEARFLGP